MVDIFRISKEEIHLDEYYELRSTAAIYYAYESIHQYLQVSLLYSFFTSHRVKIHH